MRFVKTEGTAELVRTLTKALSDAMASNLKTLWLIPGGSNIPVVVEAMAALPRKDIHRLVIMFTDERYGQIGHDDSNYQQLLEAGFLPHNATVVQTLSNSPLIETVDHAAKVVEKLFRECGAVIGFFGMGADGHMCGILPQSIAVASSNSVVGYEAGPFTRITLTPKSLQNVTVAVAGVFGAEKRQALEDLRDKTLPLDDQPAQFMKAIPHAAVFNDQIGESV